MQDPKRGNVSGAIGPYTATSGGNTHLQPEESESWSVGAIFTPRFIPDLRISLDYTRIKKTKEVTVVGLQDLLNLEDLFPGRITREALTSRGGGVGIHRRGHYRHRYVEHQHSGNRACSVRSATGLSHLEPDASASFAVYTVATLTPSLKRQYLPTSPKTETAGYAFSPLKERGTVGLDWSYGTWTLGWNTEYFDSYFVYNGGSSAATIASAAFSQGSETISGQMYSNLFASWKPASNGWLQGMEFSAGVQNVFNKSPPILATTDSTGGYSTYGDPRLRRYSIAVRKSFQ